MSSQELSVNGYSIANTEDKFLANCGFQIFLISVNQARVTELLLLLFIKKDEFVSKEGLNSNFTRIFWSISTKFFDVSLEFPDKFCEKCVFFVIYVKLV